MDQKPLRILVSPLDWGLGHATRCIPIIRHLMQLGAEIYIASDGPAGELLKQEFPGLNHLYLQGYQIDFSSSRSISINLVASTPRLIARVFAEHKQLNEIVKKYEIDIVISDNRYGLWNKNVHSIFITHQTNIIPPSKIAFLSPVARRVTRFFMNKYDECWIPDDEGDNNLSGKLSHGHPLPRNTKFIGLLSRFDKPINIRSKVYEIVAIVSGPEPYRSDLENLLTRQLSNLSLKSLLLRGKAGTETNLTTTGNLDIINHMASEELGAILKTGPIVICRGGYSTLMDLAILGNKVICIPTPGQTEQEYLAHDGQLNNKLVYVKQDQFSLAKALTCVQATTGLRHAKSNLSYKSIISNLVNKLKAS